MTLALEINDAGLTLASDGELLVEEPGIAMLDGARPETGQAAAKRARLKPVYAESRHWQDLADAPLQRLMPAARTYAEVAFAQLEDLVRPWIARGPRALIAVPAWYTREQLGLLLGIATEVGLEPVGLVDSALAAASLEPAPAQLLHLDLGLHRATLSVFEHSGDLRRTRYELMPQHGWLGLTQTWLDLISSAFVRKTRFDPLHEAGSEQRLADGLAGWLAVLADSPAVTIELPAAGGPQAVELTATDFAAAAARHYDAYVKVVQRARAAGTALELRISHRLGGLPGVSARLEELRDVVVRTLPRGAAALGALASERDLRRGPGALSLVLRLPVPLAAGAVAQQARPSTVPHAERPTHLVYASRAYPLNGRPLSLGSQVPGDHRALALPAGPGVSRLHCSVMLEDGAAWLEDHSTYGTLVNGERIGGRVELRAGDRVRIGSPGTECELVRAVSEDGAA